MNKVKLHWEKIYSTTQPHEVSWTQAIPHTSLNFIKQAGLSTDAHIIDIGGGDSNLVDHLLELGYKNITVLDISEQALTRAQLRLGEKAKKVNWIAANVLDFSAISKYDFWHDRAAFHFLTTDADIRKYVSIAEQALKPNGKLCVGTFSTDGPLKCSGLEIKQYKTETLTDAFNSCFEKINCIIENHTTPFNTFQNFLFCYLNRKQ
jgi:2-polyprenyl-3-methyl-5-hydroxy-6-metoxy-1,4-benzoquinol methylase